MADRSELPSITARLNEFDRLARTAAQCRCCPRMAGSTAVLTRRNGELQSELMFVAEAPGRLGAARSGIPLCGDQSARNFERLLESAGLRRAEVFVTNAVLCNPRDELGRNAAPLASEVQNCRPYLARTLEILDPRVVVTLGSVALRALDAIHPHNLTLRDATGRVAAWNGRLLLPLYHPSPRAQIHRPFDRQREDFAVLRSLVRHDHAS